MFVLKIILVSILVIFMWALADIALGRLFHLKKIKNEGYPFRYSDIELITSGTTLYDHLFQDIREAKKHIHILFYIVTNDEVSRAFIDLLVERAKDGIEIRLLVDRLGSHALSKENIKRLRAHGVHFSYCHKIQLPFLFYSLNQRNHRKITIVDGEIGYLGGFNIGDEYIGKNKRLGKWRDYHLRLTGEGVHDLQRQFLRDWKDDTNEDLLQEAKYFPSLKKGAYKHQIVPTHGAYLKHTFLDLIYKAKKEIIIGTPYFIPGKRITNALLHALENGITLKILVPLISDHPLIREAEYPYFRKLLVYDNCEVYHYTDGFFHAKVVIIDGCMCDIGTANMDLRSLYLNHEVNCIVHDATFIEKVEAEIKMDFSKTERVSYPVLKHLPFRLRMKEWLATLITPFL